MTLFNSLLEVDRLEKEARTGDEVVAERRLVKRQRQGSSR